MLSPNLDDIRALQALQPESNYPEHFTKAIRACLPDIFRLQPESNYPEHFTPQGNRFLGPPPGHAGITLVYQRNPYWLGLRIAAIFEEIDLSRYDEPGWPMCRYSALRELLECWVLLCQEFRLNVRDVYLLSRDRASCYAQGCGALAGVLAEFWLHGATQKGYIALKDYLANTLIQIEGYAHIHHTTLADLCRVETATRNP